MQEKVESLKQNEVEKMDIDRVLAEVDDVCALSDFYGGCTIDCPLEHLCSGRFNAQSKKNDWVKGIKKER